MLSQQLHQKYPQVLSQQEQSLPTAIDAAAERLAPQLGPDYAAAVRGPRLRNEVRRRKLSSVCEYRRTLRISARAHDVVV